MSDAAAKAAPPQPAGGVRWIVVALLFAAIALSYIDRQVLSVLKPTLQRDYGWSEIGYGDVVFYFQLAYGVGYIAFGRIVDRIGARLGYAVAVTLWTLGHMAHALVTSTAGFSLVRIPLALGESGAFPASLAAIAEWFPTKERTLAIGLFNAGTNIGAILAPLLLRRRETWAYMAGRFLIDPIWWTFLFWLPDFFGKRYGLDLRSYGPPLVAIYVLADLGSIAGGWGSSALLRQGFNLNVSRKTAMLLCALVVVPVAFAVFAHNLWLAVALIGLATAGHQGFSANLYALPSDLFPRWTAGSVVGLGGAAGAFGGMLMAKYAGWVLQTVGSYTPIFVAAACAYLLALTVVHLLVPRYRPVTTGAEPAAA